MLNPTKEGLDVETRIQDDFKNLVKKRDFSLLLKIIDLVREPWGRKNKKKKRSNT